jgi:hypothetical protein
LPAAWLKASPTTIGGTRVPGEERWDRLDDVEPVSPPAGAPGLDDHVAFAWNDLDGWFGRTSS